MIQIDDILTENRTRINEIRIKYKTTPLRLIIDLFPFALGFLIVVLSLAKLSSYTSGLVESLVTLGPNEEMVITNIDRIGVILSGYGILLSGLWAVFSVGIALIAIGIAWYTHRFSERNTKYMNEIQITSSSALTTLNQKMLSLIHNEIQDIQDLLHASKR